MTKPFPSLHIHLTYPSLIIWFEQDLYKQEMYKDNLHKNETEDSTEA